MDRHVEKMDVWDSLFYGNQVTPYSGPPSGGPLPQSVRLFGNSNIGSLGLTNMQIPGQFGRDRIAMVTNWYARTNIPPGPELDAMTQRLYCTLIIGMATRRQATLRELLGRPNGTLLEGHPANDKAELVEMVAGMLYETSMRDIAKATPADVIAEAEQSEYVQAVAGDKLSLPAAAKIGLYPKWRSLQDGQERTRWLHVGAVAVAALKPSPTLVIPVRQNFSIQVDSFDVNETFNRYIRKLDEPNWDEQGKRVSYLQRPPGHPSDRPGIWIHLEGWLVTDLEQ